MFIFYRISKKQKKKGEIMKWKSLHLVMSFLLMVLLTGCWNRLELNELSVIIGTSIDWQEDKYHVSFQVINPSAISTQTGGGGGGNSPISVFSTSGTTVLEAIQKINLESPRTPFFAHNRVLIISENLAKEKGISEVIDFFLREGETRETMDIALSKGDPRDILEILLPQEKISANGIDQMFRKTEDNLSAVKRIRLSEFAKSFVSSSANAIAPEITIKGKDGEQQSSLDALKKTTKSTVLKIGDIGVFKKGKLAGWLDQNESKGINWINNEINNTVIPFSCSENEETTSTFQVERSKTKIKPIIKEDKIIIQAKIKPEGVLQETGCNMDLTQPQYIQKLEKEIEKQIEVDIYTTWEAAKELQADVFQFGSKIHAKYPKEWKKLKPDWDQKLTEIELKLTINASVERTGMINDPFEKIMGE